MVRELPTKLYDIFLYKLKTNLINKILNGMYFIEGSNSNRGQKYFIEGSNFIGGQKYFSRGSKILQWGSNFNRGQIWQVEVLNQESQDRDLY